MNPDSTLVILTPGFPSSESDSVCLPMQQYFTRTLQELFPQIRIVVLSFQYPYHTRSYRWFGIEVIPFNGRNKGGLTRMRLRREINSTLEKIRDSGSVVGLLSFWSNECAWIGKKFANKNGVKHICWILGQDAKKENEYPKKLGFDPNELAALSDFLQAEFQKNHGIRPSAVIPPGIDRDYFGTSTETRTIDILAAGSLIPLKRFDLLLQVVAAVRKQNPGVKAVIIGDGPEKQNLLSMLSQLGLEDNVTFTGELSHGEVLQAMQKTRLFLHTSSYEGFSGVCLEALAAGAFVVSFCKPMKGDIRRWKIVGSAEEMVMYSIETLSNPNASFEPGYFFSMRQTVKEMMALFGIG